jgi:uncharacterized membrane protein YhfC
MDPLHWLAFGVEMAIMLLFPVALAVFIRRRFGVARRVFLVAACFYLLNLVVQLPFVFAANALFAQSLPWVALALTTLTYGVSEETMRYLSFRAGRTMRASRTADGALMAGVGHGGAESIVLALQAAAFSLMAIYAPQLFAGSDVTAADVLSVPYFLASAGGRVLAIIGHLAFATLIVLAYRRSWLFYPLAIVIHCVVDFTTFGAQRAIGYWSFAVFGGWVLLVLVLLLAVRRTALTRPANQPEPPELPAAPGPSSHVRAGAA